MRFGGCNPTEQILMINIYINTHIRGNHHSSLDQTNLCCVDISGRFVINLSSDCYCLSVSEQISVAGQFHHYVSIVEAASTA